MLLIVGIVRFLSAVFVCLPCQSAARFVLPSSAAAGDASTCGGAGVPPELLVSFGAGHALTLVFSSDGRLYRVANISLQYNLSDTSTFPQSSSTGETVKPTRR